MTFLVFVFMATVALATAFPSSDEITQLPGLSEKLNFRQFSGYLNATGSRRLHYWLVLSQNKPETDPVVLWLNGGPGCSSMEGILNENGPFLINPDGKTLKTNPSSWNTVANVLYIESPVGVGYSYTPETSVDYNDDMAAEDNYQALKSFFSLFDDLKKNDFYITGESYAGIYVPTLAVKVMNDPEIKLKGSAVGNGFNDAGLNENSLLYFAYYHGLVDRRTFNDMLDKCNCKNTTRSWCDFLAAAQGDQDCADIVDAVNGKIYSSGLNVYNLYQDCYQKSDWVSVFQNRRLMYTRVRKASMKYMRTPSLTTTPACVDAGNLVTYMNSDAVKKALHIPDGLPTWDICSDTVTFNYKRTYHSTAQFYKKLLQDPRHFKMIIYNGDVDMACNFLGDEWFTDGLGSKLLSDYYAWHIKKDDGPQVAGYIKKYDGISFITIRGSGHMVPQDKPAEALMILKNLLNIVPL